VVDLECLTDAKGAAALLDPLRRRVLAEAREPSSATEIAARLRLPRQKVNYHVRELARARLLRRAGDRRKRNLIERRWEATARSYVLAPQVLGELGADPRLLQNQMSVAHLVALAAQTQRDLAATLSAGKPQPTLSLVSEFHFESARQREEFARALHAAIIDVVARYTSPGQGRPFRLTAGCYPIPSEEQRT
jgi:DNA-binding transcriptional ArsR family regulator